MPSHLQASTAVCCLVDLGFCEYTDYDDGPLESCAPSNSSPWTVSLDIYVRLCDRILEPGLIMDLSLSELVALSTAVAKAGMGEHPVMNAISGAILMQLMRF